MYDIKAFTLLIAGLSMPKTATVDLPSNQYYTTHLGGK